MFNKQKLESLKQLGKQYAGQAKEVIKSLTKTKTGFHYTPTLLCDFYKISHRIQYPEGTTLVYSNLTPRNNKYYKGDSDKVVFFGLQYFIKKVLIDMFNNDFFNKSKEQVVEDYKRVIKNCLFVPEPDTSHIEALHNLGYLPLEIKALEEGTKVNYGIPVLTVVNTLPEFFWLTNFIETVMSSDLWMACNNATLAHDYFELCKRAAYKTCDSLDHLPFQCHDFSFRGMAGHESAMVSGMAHLLSFKGTDTIPAINAHEYYYNADMSKELIGCSIPASEHSVMAAGGMEDEEATYRRFINELYPTGFVSIVSDTWDFFKVLTQTLPKLKDDILKRDGKVVIRPDSGDPVDIICGKTHGYIDKEKHDLDLGDPEHKGAIELLWDIFGGTVNEKGFMVLNPKIGLIYGDSITLERAKEIFERLEAKGFASSNVVFGVGSYTYQYNTRDSQGWAVKATYVEVNGEGRNIYKQPKTDSSKNSAKGLLKVIKTKSGNYKLKDECTWEEEQSGELKTVFSNGKLTSEKTLDDIRTRVNI